jgi:hypothetical protein
MSFFFDSPELIKALHEDRVRRLQQHSRQRRLRRKPDGRRGQED